MNLVTNLKYRKINKNGFTQYRKKN